VHCRKRRPRRAAVRDFVRRHAQTLRRERRNLVAQIAHRNPLDRAKPDHTAESIKSLEGFRIAWIDEAQSLSARSLSLLRPTIRAQSFELWARWNPRRRSDSIDDFLRTRKPDGAVVVQANWRDNPWFPAVLEEERKTDLSRYPDRYDHIDTIVDARAEAIARRSPGVPLEVIRNLLVARAPACRCAQYLEVIAGDAG
jgi:hypothetical protein